MSTKSKNREALKMLEEISGKKLTLGNLLWSIRKCEELSQVEFAEKLNISKQYLCDIEHGRRFASPKMAAEYAQKLGYSVTQFIRLCLQDMIDRDGIRLRVDVNDAA
ncbi:MAG: helix-turn-helix transcriptional regulator [Legionellales bacterium]|nr:helix-turn-helix transcriptional regulator [Legionellales bacterium]